MSVHPDPTACAGSGLLCCTIAHRDCTTAAGGGAIAASLGTLQSLALGDARLANVSVMIADFLSALGQVIGETLDGIVGYNYLREFQVTIDYPERLLKLANGPEAPSREERHAEDHRLHRD